jgi:hypothetical protein
MFAVVYSVIQDMAADGSLGSIRADADTSFSYLSSFEFIFILCLTKEMFEITEVLGQAVQKKSQDIVNAVRLVSTTKECLEQLRSDFPQDVYALQQQLKHFIVDASNDEELKNISTLIDLCRCLVETGRHNIYNLIDRLLRLLITLPVSTASAERAFSSMKIIKTRLRNKMEDDYLANNLLVNIEGDILDTYNYDEVIADFRSKKGRKADL